MTSHDTIIKQWLDGDWPVCFSGDMSDEDARKHAAFRLSCAEEDIELLRHNVVLCRYNPKEAGDEHA